MNNREIKFRIWDKEKSIFLHNEFEDYDLVYCPTDNEWYILGGHKLGERFVMQEYTGKHDCDGLGIYEGDLVETIYPEHSRAKVVFDNWTASYRLETLDKKSIPLVIYRLDGNGGGEFMLTAKRVVGHIFQNALL